MAGSRVMDGGARDSSLQAIFDCVALPLLVVDHAGLVVLANPVALAALGFELTEFQGRHAHNTVHYLHPDGSPYPAEDCPFLEPSRSGEAVHGHEGRVVTRWAMPCSGPWSDSSRAGERGADIPAERSFNGRPSTPGWTTASVRAAAHALLESVA